MDRQDPKSTMRSRHVLTGVGRAWSSHHSRRPRKRSRDSMTDSPSCARSNPARPLLGLLLRSLSIRRNAAATRSRARSRSATVYCRGSGRVRFLRGPFADLLARMAALSCFPVAIVASPIILADPANQTYSERLREPGRAIPWRCDRRRRSRRRQSVAAQHGVLLTFNTSKELRSGEAELLDRARLFTSNDFCNKNGQ
jgi:hypothetical protein